jgi:hypothetical protein
VDHAAVQRWLDRYVEAWRANEPGPIEELFSSDAQYRFHPADEPMYGRAAIAASWLDDPDEPGSWDAWYHPYAVEGSRAVAIGVSTYFDGVGLPARVFDNVFVLAFDDEGRCGSFTEWYRQRPEDQTPAP